MVERSTYERPPLKVTHDSDGGLTVHDPQSGIVLSVIGTHPAANGPKGLFVEVYAYVGGPVAVHDVTRPGRGADEPVAHPTFAFYALKEPVA